MDTLLYRFTKQCRNIAAFDLDGTLIKTRSGKKFPINSDDYQYAFDNVQKRINDLLLKNYKIVIFTNQKGIKTKKTNKIDIINKITQLFPFADYFISTDDDIYRKPMIGMYDKFIELNGETDNMFYVGDAAGRENDHSSADINFAYNARIKFMTEIEFFLNIEDNYKIKFPILPIITNKVSDFKKYNNNVVVIMQGLPYSGKTSFIKEYIEYNKITDYLHLSNDKNTKSKLMKEFKKGLEDNKLIFIDNLNATRKNRTEFIKLLPEDYSAIGIFIKTPIDIALQLNQYRYYISNLHKIGNIGKEYCGIIRSKVPKVAYNSFNKRFEKMEKDEGLYKVYEYMPEIKLKYIF